MAQFMQQDGDKQEQGGENPHGPIHHLRLSGKELGKEAGGETPGQEDENKPPREMQPDIYAEDSEESMSAAHGIRKE